MEKRSSKFVLLDVNKFMKYRVIIILIFSLIIFKLSSCSDDKEIIRSDLKSEFDSLGYDGCFILLNTKTGQRTYINHKRTKEQFSPASTFKIPHTLIALQTGVVGSIHDTIRYNGIPKSIESWNRDHDLESAFKYSVVWYYQDIANRIGNAKMKFWLDTLKDYGTMLRAGQIDKFWLDGSLVISANQQVDFLNNLVSYKLPFSRSNIEKLKQIMLFEDKPDYKIYAKTGLSDVDNVGWFVGWVEKSDNTYIFVTNITTKDTLNNKFVSSRVLITKKLLNKLRVI